MWAQKLIHIPEFMLEDGDLTVGNMFAQPNAAKCFPSNMTLTFFSTSTSSKCKYSMFGWNQSWCWGASCFLRDLVDEAKDFHLMPERRPHLPAFKTRQRCCTSITGLIYAVGGLNSSGMCFLISCLRHVERMKSLMFVLAFSWCHTGMFF